MGNNEYKDIKFANWNPVYQDIATEIAHIRKVGGSLYFKAESINLYYSLVSNLYSTYSQGLEDPELMLRELRKIEEIIFSTKYIELVDKKAAKNYQRKIINKLMGLFTLMCRDFSDAGLTPKITIKRKTDPKKAILGENY